MQITVATAENIIGEYEANFRKAVETGRFNESVYPDTLDVLARLYEQGITIMVHSGRYTHLSRPQLASVGLAAIDAGGLVYSITGGNDGDKGQQIRLNLERAGLTQTPDKLVVVGDGTKDMDAGKLNNTRTAQIAREA